MIKKLLTLLAVSLVISINVSAVNITIIQSQGTFSWSGQDMLWKNYATSMGYHAVIDTVTILSDTAFFANTDVLVFSEAAVALTDTQLQNVIQFVKEGKSAYIQSEYETSFQGNILFQAIMDSVKADFHWVSTVNGQLVPMLILGSFATTPYQTDSLSYFNYGVSGTGSGVDSFLAYNGAYFGFYYHSSVHYGSVITVSDEDWVWMNADSLLMKNMLYHLVGYMAGVNDLSKNENFTIFPNPASHDLTVALNSNYSEAEVKIFNMLGKLEYSAILTRSTAIIDISSLANGIYIVQIATDNGVAVQKFIRE